MIKFIASDLDGTLLPPSKILPAEVFELIEKLHKRGIIFCPASGRQLPNLMLLFKPVLDKIAIIAENGSIGWFRGKIVYTNPMKNEHLTTALDVIRGIDGLYPLFSCADCAYYESDNRQFIDVVTKSYSSTKKSDLDELAANGTVMKISVWDENPPCSEHGGKILPPKLQGMRAVVSGYDWLDVSSPDANKGKALEALMSVIEFGRDECMAFGDHMNDLEMLNACGQPYVTENAFAELKAVFKNRVPSNAEYGVLQKLRQLI